MTCNCPEQMSDDKIVAFLNIVQLQWRGAYDVMVTAGCMTTMCEHSLCRISMVAVSRVATYLSAPAPVYPLFEAEPRTDEERAIYDVIRMISAACNGDVGSQYLCPLMGDHDNYGGMMTRTILALLSFRATAVGLPPFSLWPMQVELMADENREPRR
jgi:hypothetical protein